MAGLALLPRLDGVPFLLLLRFSLLSLLASVVLLFILLKFLCWVAVFVCWPLGIFTCFEDIVAGWYDAVILVLISMLPFRRQLCASKMFSKEQDLVCQSRAFMPLKAAFTLPLP